MENGPIGLAFHLPVLNSRFSIPGFPFLYPVWFRLCRVRGGLRLAARLGGVVGLKLCKLTSPAHPFRAGEDEGEGASVRARYRAPSPFPLPR